MQSEKKYCNTSLAVEVKYEFGNQLVQTYITHDREKPVAPGGLSRVGEQRKSR